MFLPFLSCMFVLSSVSSLLEREISLKRKMFYSLLTTQFTPNLTRDIGLEILAFIQAKDRYFSDSSLLCDSHTSMRIPGVMRENS